MWGVVCEGGAGSMIQATVSLMDPEWLLPLFGARDQHLRLLREAFHVKITHRDGQIRVAGAEGDVQQATEALEQLQAHLARRGMLTVDDVRMVVDRLLGKGPAVRSSPIDVYQSGRHIEARTVGQARYVQAVREHPLTFVVGPAGTGKTYLAVALAVEALKHRLVRKIVLVRPAVEAGESLGFLPGDLYAKIGPYLRPLLDALRDMIDYELMKRFMEQDVIEVIPLAYMRGRTLNEAFIILDEAQNATVSQMKMFLTRMGNEAKIVVCGDITQIDLREGTRSGLVDALHRLRGIEGICQVYLDRGDIVRHRLVQQIVQAYEQGADAAHKAHRR
ncbi:MAG: phosphate starvation protein PhoH [Pirellulaceae bacterium]|nr:MAG: phosphate starvation protein PhoH [Pirellulaceae bacterium]